MFINWWLDKQNVLTNATLWMNLENIVLQKEPETQDHILYNFIYVKCPE